MAQKELVWLVLVDIVDVSFKSTHVWKKPSINTIKAST
jgi:hypothetical protein